MAVLRIAIGNRFDGDYELDLEGRPFTGWDAHIIKEIAGIRLGELEAAGEAMDYDLVIAIAVIALQRHQKIERKEFRVAADLLLEAEAGRISWVEEAAVEPVPPPSTESDSSSAGSSGPTSNGSSDPPASIPTRIGGRG